MESAFQTPITIKEAINSIQARQYLLPAIQREFVWKPEQITKLFDSLMRGYPIGSFLLWQVSKEKIRDFQFYEFVKDYHERDNTHNPKADIIDGEHVTSVLDGQQRLTALYIAFKGTYAFKTPRMHYSNDNAYPRRKLHLNLLSESDDFDMRYNFSFLTEEEAASEKSDTSFWFEVSKILDFEGMQEINKYLRDNGLIQSEFAEKCLFKLFEKISVNKVINYYLETSQELEKVLNIFIRVNSGGTQLSYSDLLLSIATAQWDKRDAREEINSFVDEINRIDNGFNFDKDFVLKSCLVLSGLKDIRFKVDNFNTANMNKIEEMWPEITTAIKLAVELVSNFGYNYQTLTSTNAIIPISYYLLKKNAPSNFILSSAYKQDREDIKKWLTTSLIKRAFSGQPDNVLRPIRAILQENTEHFPLEEITNKFKGTTKSLTFTEEDIDALLYSRYGQGHTFSILALLYPTLDFRNRFHQDHIFPKSLFTPSILRKKGVADENLEFNIENFNYIGNLQLLEGLPNEEKSNKEFELWLEETHKNDDEKMDYLKKNHIPKGISYSMSNFKEFFEKRNVILKEILTRTLT